MTSITAAQLARLQQTQTVHLIDVRSPVEFGALHAQGATNIPLDHLQPESLAYCNGDPVYLICKSGIRARRGMDKLAESGFDNMVLVEGGTDAWKAAGLPIEKGRRALGVDQQVRIVAGAMALLGSAIVLSGHTLGLALVAMMGTGMIYAGITDTCGMASLLARMPWNQGSRVCPATGN